MTKDKEGRFGQAMGLSHQVGGVLVRLIVLPGRAAVASRRALQHVRQDWAEGKRRDGALESQVEHDTRDGGDPAHAGETQQALQDQPDGDDDLPTGGIV